MFEIEIYSELDGIFDWRPASYHTQEIDRADQFQRFLDSGILPENIRNKA